jgi:hypothetical protein
MERVERADMAEIGSERAYERYGWTILTANAILGIFAAVLTSSPSLSLFPSPQFGSAYPIMGALGTALVSCNIFALVITLVPYRRNERWAWYTLWMLPLLWLFQFVFSPDITYLMLAALTTLGLVLPYRRFFSCREKDPPRVN